MDGYDQLWSLVEAAGTDGFPTLADDLLSMPHAASTPSGDAFLHEVSASRSSGDELFAAGFLAAAAGDAFFPIERLDAASPFAAANDFLPGLDLSGADQTLVLPVANGGVKDVYEPLVLPGVMDDSFLLGGDDDGRQFLPGIEDDFRVEAAGEHVLGRHAADGGLFETPVDHTLPVDAHGLIGAHGSDDWLF